MQSHRSVEHRRGIRPFRGQVEVLEGRALLSCTVQEAAGVMLIRGSNAADIMEVEDFGSNASGQIRVECNNGAANRLVLVATNTEPIATIMIDADLGNDSVRYELQDGSTLMVSRNVIMDLGPGRNLGKVDAGKATIDANLSVDVRSGDGKDTIIVDANAGINRRTGLFVPTIITAGHTLAVSVDAGLGSDTLNATANLATINGAMTLNLNGGGGADRLTGAAVDLALGDGGLLGLTLDGGLGDDRVNLNARIARSGLGSQVNIALLGSDHNDRLSLQFAGSAPAIALLLDGGLGTDSCRAPAGLLPPLLTMINCER